MAHIYKTSEWQTAAGWYVNDTSDLVGQAGLWYIPARLLNMTPAQYIEWLVKEYQPDRIIFDEILIFSWNKEHYDKAHAYSLYINSVARRKKFFV